MRKNKMKKITIIDMATGVLRNRRLRILAIKSKYLIYLKLRFKFQKIYI